MKHTFTPPTLLQPIQFSSVQDGIYALGKPIYMRSTPSQTHTQILSYIYTIPTPLPSDGGRTREKEKKLTHT